MPFETSPTSISEVDLRCSTSCWIPVRLTTSDPTGCRCPGGETVTKVVTGVSAQRELIERAVALEAELVLVHHGLFWDFLPTGLTPTLAERLRPLFKHDDRASPPTTCRSTPTPRSATTRCSPACSAASATRRSPAIGRLGEFAGEGIAAAELFARVREVTRARAARVRRRPGARAPDRDHLRLGGQVPAAGGRARARRVPDRRAGRARDGRRARGRDPLHRRRATTRRRRSASAGWAICSPSTSGSSTISVDIPNPV